jgi:hypothetical protein
MAYAFKARGQRHGVCRGVPLKEHVARRNGLAFRPVLMGEAF